jgi:tetratricopeptide (TPR) repeat protein
VEAIPRFTRAIGAARSNNLALAREEVAALDQLRQKLEQANDSYWATLTDAQRLAAAAWLAHAEKNDDEAVRLARSAAEREESVEKHPVTPGPLLPARELEGDLLLELKRYPDALASYEKVLQREPRRARALFGAGRAAELASNRTAARKYYTELLDLLKNADAGRPEPNVAKAYLSKTGN